MKKIEIVLRAALVPLDFLLTVGAFYLAYQLRLRPEWLPWTDKALGYIPPWQEYLPFVLAMALFLNIIFFLQQLYKLRNYKRLKAELPDLLYAIFIWSMFIMAWFFLRREFFFSRLVLGLSIVGTILAVLGSRTLIHLLKRVLWKMGKAKRKLIVIGDGPVAERVLRDVQKSQVYALVLRLNDLDWEKLEQVAEKEQPDELIQTKSGLSLQDKAELLEFCREHKIAFKFLSSLFELHTSNIEISNIAGLPIIELKPTALDGWGSILKRIVDMVLSLILLLILTAPFLIIGIIIKLDSRGPVFVALKRINQGQAFRIYKFRSMVKDAEQLKSKLREQNERQGPLFKLKNDPRVTQVGKFLRKSRIDELPQLWNVLRGEMSLVGPRPHEPEEVAQYERKHRRLLTIKPGMTGLAQVKGASDLSFEEEYQIDTYYIEQWSIWLDLEILLKTIWVVLTGRGAA